MRENKLIILTALFIIIAELTLQTSNIYLNIIGLISFIIIVILIFILLKKGNGGKIEGRKKRK